MFSSFVVNSTLHNATLANCTVQSSRLYDSSYNNTLFIPEIENIQHNESRHKSQVIEKNTNFSGGLNVTLLVFGVLGIIILMAAILGAGIFVTRYTVKKQQEMSLVRSAVMGNVKSY